MVMALIAVTVHAQQGPPSSSDQSLSEIVVTGSMIKRTDTDTPSPVQIVSAVDIQNSGYTNVSDVLRTLSANGAGTLNQGFGQAFASGGGAAYRYSTLDQDGAVGRFFLLGVTAKF
jgi:iron complex outermembrane recepter protein